MKRVALFALVTTVICSSVTDALARGGPGAPSFSAPSLQSAFLQSASPIHRLNQGGTRQPARNLQVARPRLPIQIHSARQRQR